MIHDGKILERRGNYYLEQADSAYAIFSGYAYLIFYQPPTFCQPKQLQGFPAGALEQAKAALEEVATKGLEEKRFQARKATVEKDLEKGLMPCPHEDRELARHLASQGYTPAKRTRSHTWYAPPKEAQ